MVTISDYIKNITKKILDSIYIIENLDNDSDSLEILKIELKHINGLILIIIRKLESRDKISELHSALLTKSKDYLDSNYFFRELQQINDIYSNDQNRIKNIRKLIVDSFYQKKFFDVLNELQNN